MIAQMAAYCGYSRATRVLTVLQPGKARCASGEMDVPHTPVQHIDAQEHRDVLDRGLAGYVVAQVYNTGSFMNTTLKLSRKPLLRFSARRSAESSSESTGSE
jgi:hypothetical protein